MGRRAREDKAEAETDSEDELVWRLSAMRCLAEHHYECEECGTTHTGSHNFSRCWSPVANRNKWLCARCHAKQIGKDGQDGKDGDKMAKIKDGQDGKDQDWQDGKDQDWHWQDWQDGKDQDWQDDKQERPWAPDHACASACASDHACASDNFSAQTAINQPVPGLDDDDDMGDMYDEREDKYDKAKNEKDDAA